MKGLQTLSPLTLLSVFLIGIMGQLNAIFASREQWTVLLPVFVIAVLVWLICSVWKRV